MFKHLLMDSLVFGAEGYEGSRKKIVSYDPMGKNLRIKLQKGKLSVTELTFLVAEVLRTNDDVRQKVLNWTPANYERGTYTKEGYSGCKDYYVLFEDSETGFINRRKVFHSSMSGWVTPTYGQYGVIDLFLPDFCLLALRNELPVSKNMMVQALKAELDDSGCYEILGNNDQTELKVLFKEMKQSGYVLYNVGPLSQYMEYMDKDAEEEVAGEVVGE